MSSRKNINDTIHGDRSMVRGGQLKVPSMSWDEFQDKKRKAELDDIFDKAKGTSSKTKSSSVVPYTGPSSRPGGFSCFETHPPLTMPGTDKVIFGGSCCRPSVTDAEVYIGFDSGMAMTQRSWPWKKGTEFLFKIRDMEAPSDAAEFIKLVAWVKKQLDAGVKVHCGCIGGHGRTGTFLSALVSQYGELDAISYVRENYCKRAVESRTQVEFLKKHFGIKDASGYKENWGAPSKGGSKGSKGSSKATGGPTLYAPMPGNGSIWDAPLDL